MILLATILVLAVVATGAPVDEGRIVGGKNTTIEEYPHQVSLEQGGRHFCGGTIIGENYVVTAAHCIMDVNPEQITVRAGSTRRENGGVSVKLEKLSYNPNFDLSDLDGDVGVLKLKTPLKFSNKIKAISLVPINKEPGINELLTVTGWGATKKKSRKERMAEILQVVNVPAIDRGGCRDAYGDRISNNMICAGVPGKDSCYGDSGGPLINSKRQLVGIVSWGLGCGVYGYPGVYGSIASPFIHNFITDFVNGTQKSTDYHNE